MNLSDMPMKDLLDLHNSIAAKPATPKTFATKAKLIERIRSIQAAQGVTTAEPEASQSAKPTKAPRTNRKKKESKPRGIGVGALARELLMDPAGYVHSRIAEMVNERIAGASATAQSIRWYATKMRADGMTVPERVAASPEANLRGERAAKAVRATRRVKKGAKRGSK